MSADEVWAVDTETTGLDERWESAWEIAAVNVGSGVERVWRIEPDPAHVAAMHPKAADKNRFWERTTEPGWTWDDAPHALCEIADTLEGAHLVGVAVDFDARHLSQLFWRHHRVRPVWNHHLLPVDAMAVAWLHGRAVARNGLVVEAATLPYRSDDLSVACGVEPPGEDDRHTALGDARWAARWYRQLTA